MLANSSTADNSNPEEPSDDRLGGPTSPSPASAGLVERLPDGGPPAATPRRRAGRRRIDFQEVAANADLLRVIADDLGPPDPSGRHHCPFHDDTNPSLSTKTGGAKPVWRCWACPARGDAIEYVERRKNFSPLEAARYLVANGYAPSRDPTGAQRPATPSGAAPPNPGPVKEKSGPASPAGPTPPRAAGSLSTREAHGLRWLDREARRRLWAPGYLGVLSWLKYTRHLSEQTIADAGLGFVPHEGFGLDGSGLYLPMGVWVPFSAADGWPAGGQVRRLSMPEFGDPADGRKYHFVGPPGVTERLYPGPAPAGGRPVVVDEGAVDALLLAQAAAGLGVDVVALVSASVRRLEPSSLDSLRGRRVFLATDSDEAGDASAAHWAGVLGAEAVRARVPRGKDVGEFRRLGGDVRGWVEGLLGFDENLLI